jgi:hypothetical protein
VRYGLLWTSLFTELNIKSGSGTKTRESGKGKRGDEEETLRTV